MAKNMSHAQVLANRANALKSTGPRTDVGKAVSSMNSAKHGFCSTSISLDEDQDAVKATHESWTDCLKPRNDVARALVDLSFRQKRRLERVFAAEEAAVAERIADVQAEIVEDRRRFIAEAEILFADDPFQAYPLLRVTADGVLSLLGRLGRWRADVGLGVWSADHARRLAAVQGADADDVDPFLDSAVRVFDVAHRLSVTAQTTADLEDREAVRAREAARAALRELAPTLEEHRAGLLERIAAEVDRLQRERIVAQVEEAKLIRMRIDQAKIDETEEGRLRRRYISDAQRDFLRSLKEATAACEPPKTGPQTTETARTAPSPVPTASAPAAGTGARSEPKSDHAEDDENTGRDAAPTPVRRRRRA